MSGYQVRAEDLPKVVRFLRIAAKRCYDVAENMPDGNVRWAFENEAKAATRIADEMEGK